MKIAIFNFIFVSIFVCSSHAFDNQNNIDCFEILSSAGVSTLASCIKTYQYEADDFGQKLVKKLNNDKKSNSPELLIAQEFFFLKNGEVENALKLHKDINEKEKAKKRYSKKNVLEFVQNWEDIKFISRFDWGPFVRIRYDLVSGSNFFYGINYLKKKDGEYNFTDEVNSSHIFSYIASTHPWNRTVSSKFLQPKMSSMEKIILRYDDKSGKPLYLNDDYSKHVDGDIIIAFMLHRFPSNCKTLLNDYEHKIPSDFYEVVKFVGLLVEKSKTGSDEELLNLLDHEYKKKFNNDKDRLVQLRDTYKDYENIEFLSILKSDKGNILYYRPKINGLYQNSRGLVYTNNGQIQLSKFYGDDFNSVINLVMDEQLINQINK